MRVLAPGWRQAGLALLLAGLAATAVAAEPVIAVIVPAQRNLTRLAAQDLGLIYLRKKLLWPDGQRIAAVNLPADHPLRQRFSRLVLRQSPQDLEDYWNQQYFQGVLPPHVLASEAAVLRFVAETETGIGYLGYCAMDARVRPVLLISPGGEFLPADTPVHCEP